MLHYATDRPITAAQFIDVLNRSTLGERRPVADPARIQTMLDHGNVLVTAWDGEVLVGVSRALTDFSFCCYLSDLAVDEAYQHQGIGKKLVELTHEASGPQTTLILLAAPKAVDYYPKIGMERHEACYVLHRSE
ncbi:MAG: GNAT family N-acetyltransferase [Cytophagaceae bacterium]|nr:GNAT family N-acetyltransferase [Cytophagaceae bacterium]